MELATLPLQIIGPWILVFAVRTEGTDVAWGIVDQAVAYHFVLPLETFAALTPRASFYGTVMWSVLRVNVRMRAEFKIRYTPRKTIPVLT